jgi:hypothetical protein
VLQNIQEAYNDGAYNDGQLSADLEAIHKYIEDFDFVEDSLV